MSWREQDDTRLLRTFEEWRRNQADPDAMPVGELIDMFTEERAANLTSRKGPS
jgi:hypothetical protein